MTLNASGPISLGGATTGQSINLELGQSATALASINASNFRTLAGVASGQISLSNFYGKSNSFGWIAYVTGSGNQASTANAFFADPSGNTYFSYKGGTSADFSAIAKINSSGTTVTYTRPWADDFLSVNVPPHSSLYTGDANFFASSRSSDLNSYPYSTLNSSLGYQSGKRAGGGTALTYPENAALTPDGRVYVAGRYNDKFLPSRVICLSTSGTSLGGWVSGLSSSYNAAVAPRTDNSAYWIYKTGSVITWCTLPAGGGAPSGKQVSFAWSDGGYAIEYATTDSSNNLYAITSPGRIFKVDSSGTSISGCYPSTGELQGGMSSYGSNIYVMTTNSSYTGIILRCYNTSLTPQWVNTFTFSGTSTNMSGNTGRVMATAQGVFMFVNNNTLGNFIIKVPLTGVPSNSSKALTAPSGLTLNWTTSSFSVTSLGFGSISSSSPMSTFTYTPSTSITYPPGATTAPANTNTSL